MKNRVSHITPADGNVFADLGFKANEAITLQKRSQEIIDKHPEKASLIQSLPECPPPRKVTTGRTKPALCGT